MSHLNEITCGNMEKVGGGAGPSHGISLSCCPDVFVSDWESTVDSGVCPYPILPIHDYHWLEMMAVSG